MEAIALQTYAKLESYYWWWVGRRAVIASVMAKHFGGRSDLNMLDWGCGPGGNFPVLAPYGSLLGVDASPEALRFCREAGHANVRPAGTVAEFMTAYPERNYDLITVFDVVEHIEGDVQFLRELQQLLKPGGHLLITVPAYQFLWSELDVAVSHVRRYTRGRITRALRTAGYSVQRASYFITIMAPLIIAFRLLGHLTGRSKKKQFSFVEFPSSVNRLFINTIRLEAKLLRWFNLPFGTSLIVLAQRRD